MFSPLHKMVPPGQDDDACIFVILQAETNTENLPSASLSGTLVLF